MYKDVRSVNLKGAYNRVKHRGSELLDMAKEKGQSLRKKYKGDGSPIPQGEGRVRPGVGENMKPPVFLKGGEEVVLGVDKLGTQKHKVKSYK